MQGLDDFNKSQKQSSPFAYYQPIAQDLIQYAAPHPHHVGNESELVRQLAKEKKKKQHFKPNLMLAFDVTNIKAFFHFYLIKINH